jgi:hypothetical protein
VWRVFSDPDESNPETSYLGSLKAWVGSWSLQQQQQQKSRRYLALRVDMPGTNYESRMSTTGAYGWGRLLGPPTDLNALPGGCAQRCGGWEHPDLSRQGSWVPVGWLSWHTSYISLGSVCTSLQSPRFDILFPITWAAARGHRDGSTAPIERVPCPSRRPIYLNGPANDGRNGRFDGSFSYLLNPLIHWIFCANGFP